MNSVSRRYPRIPVSLFVLQYFLENYLSREFRHGDTSFGGGDPKPLFLLFGQPHSDLLGFFRHGSVSNAALLKNYVTNMQGCLVFAMQRIIATPELSYSVSNRRETNAR